MTLVDQILLGLYIGVMTGMFAALLIFGLGFTFQYVAGVAFPATMGLMIGLGAAGLQGGMFRLMRDPQMLQSPVIITALLVVLLSTNYAQRRATELAKAAPPKQVLFGKLRRKTLSPEVVKQLGRFGQVRVRTTGEVQDMEGYPPLPDDVRRAIREGEWTFPADLPVPELEKRLAEQLRTEHDLADVAVDIDEQGQATITAAPPSSGLSRRVPEGRHAVTLDAVVPTGLAYGDEVRVDLGATGDGGDDGNRETAEPVTGTVVSVKPPEAKKEGDGDGKPKASPVQTAAGGEARVAVAVDPADVGGTVTAEPSRFVVEPRGRNRGYELVSLLRNRGNAFRKVTVREGGSFVGRTLAELALRSSHGIDVLAIKHADAWQFAPGGTTTIGAGDELFLTGPREAIDAVAEATA